MTTIPDDIMKAAMEAYLSLMDDDFYDDHKYGSGHIARALLAERERCAKVADKYSTLAVARYIAIGIRKGGKP